MIRVIPPPYSPLAVRTLMGLVPTVDLPVPVKTAGVRQLLPANLALHRWLAVGPDLTSSTFVTVRCDAGGDVWTT